MNRRLFRKWALWLLPLLVARAFLPVGFMLSAGSNGLELVFCAGQAPALAQALAAAQATSDHAAHGAHHAQDHLQHHIASEHASHHDGSQLDPPCPYALAVVGVATDIPHVQAESALPTDESAEHQSRLLASVGPIRADRIRGPPALS